MFIYQDWLVKVKHQDGELACDSPTGFLLLDLLLESITKTCI